MTVRAACIGTGGISPVHLNLLKERDDVEIVALCDINETILEKRQEEYGGKGFTDFEEMLDSVELDAVWLCTPPQVRREPLLLCADRGLPVMCEKPVERDPVKAGEIAAELKARNAHVQVGYVLRSMGSVQEFQKERADDQIHLVQSFYGCDIGLTRGMAPWFYDKALSGGALVDQATHNLDLLRMLVGEVREVRGVASNPVQAKIDGYTIDETLALSFVFEDGTVGGHVHTWVGDGWRNEIFFSGEKRSYRLDIWRRSLTIEEKGESRVFKEPEGRLHDAENVRFLEMVQSGDWSKNPSDYADAAATLQLTLDCDRAVSGG